MRRCGVFSAPVAANPNIAMSAPAPMSANPYCMGMGANHVAATHPYPPAAAADGPVAGSPGIFGSRRDGHHFDLRGWRGFCHNRSVYGGCRRRNCLRLGYRNVFDPVFDATRDQAQVCRAECWDCQQCQFHMFYILNLVLRRNGAKNISKEK
jgi:hypothetical protein